MDSRIYYAERYYTHYKSEDAPERLKDYITTETEWNINVNQRQAMLNLYFGKGIVEKFHEIHDSFISLGQKIKFPNSNNIEVIRKDADYINHLISQFCEKLEMEIANDNVGRIPELNKKRFSIL